jgi:hypothetical protein
VSDTVEGPVSIPEGPLSLEATSGIRSRSALPPADPAAVLPAIAIPKLYCPFDGAVSEHAPEIDAGVIAWAERVGLLADASERGRFEQTRVGWLAARTCPRGDVAGLSLLADWQMWLFAFDDRFCDEGEAGMHPGRVSRLVVRFLSVLESGKDLATETGRHGEVEALAVTPAPPETPKPPLQAFVTGLVDLRRRIIDRAGRTRWARFSGAVTGYFLALFWEATHRASGTPAALPEYQMMRRHSGAVPTCTSLIDVANGFELAASEYHHPDVQALTSIAVDVACWANDILSYPKEALRSRAVQSLPAVLAARDGLGLQEAIDRAADMHDARVRRYLAKEAPVRASASPELQRYLDDLRFWMRGNLDWSYETGRYTVLL